MTVVKKSLQHFFEDVLNIEKKCNDHAQQWLQTYQNEQDWFPRYQR